MDNKVIMPETVQIHQTLDQARGDSEGEGLGEEEEEVSIAISPAGTIRNTRTRKKPPKPS